MEAEGHLQKKFGVFTLVSLGVGTMVGSGIFAVPAAMAVVAGPGLILAILFAGLITTLLALAYAELGAAFPLVGGPYSLPRLAMGNFNGFIMGWGYFLYMFVGTAAIIDIFIVYLGFYVPGLAIGQTLTVLGVTIALIALWIFTIINVIGVKWGGLYCIITTIGKLIPLFLFAVIGFAFVKGGNFQPFFPFGFEGIGIAMTLFFWSYTGFESIVVPTAEMKNPSKTIPTAMLLTMFITILVYVIIAIVFVGMIDWLGLGYAQGDWSEMGKLSSPLAQVSSAQHLPWLAAIATVGAIIATAGAGGDWVLLQGRLPYAMAKDKLFWSKMCEIHPRFSTPMYSIILASILTSIVIIAIPAFPSVALIASITALVPYAAAALSVPILRKKQPDVERPFKLPFPFLIPILGFILASLLIYWASWPWTLVGAILILLGYPVFLFVGRDFQFIKNAWIPIYLIGLVIVSVIGDPKFVMNNFTSFKPLGYLKMPYDIIVIVIFSIFIFFRAYFSNANDKAEKATIDLDN